MRYPLATPLKTRTGAPDKDARLKNSYVEARGDQSVVRKRCAAQGGVIVGTGQAQGGIGITVGGTEYVITVNNDTLTKSDEAAAGTSWDEFTEYNKGDHVSYDFKDFWSNTDTNVGNTPTPGGGGGGYWNEEFVEKEDFNPTTITLFSNAATIDWRKIAYGNSTFVGVGDIFALALNISFSTNGEDWTATSFPGVVDTSDEVIVYGAGLFVALGKGVFTVNPVGFSSVSLDGSAWSTIALPASLQDFQPVDVAYGGGKFVAVGVDATYDAAYSINGLSWTPVAFGFTPQAIAFGNSRFVTIGTGTDCAYSVNGGATWTTATLPSSHSWEVLGFGNGKFYAAVINSNVYAYSTNGKDWTESTLPVSAKWHGFTAANGLLIFVGENACIKSEDGITWQSISTSVTWVDVTFGMGKAVLLGDSIDIGNLT